MSDISESIREILVLHANLPVDISRLSDEDDLYQNGFTSHASVNVMLAIEDTFNVEFPDSLLRKSSFQSVKAIADLLESLSENNPTQ